MKHHYHITVRGVDNTKELQELARSIKGKVTLIDMVMLDEKRRDCMITKYQNNDSMEQLLTDIQTIESKGYEVIRYKLEQDLDKFSDVEREITPSNYIEMHIKVANNDNDYDGFVKSNNPNELGYQFYNARVRSKTELTDMLCNASSIFLKENLKSISIEHIVFDSNASHDNF